MNKAKDLLHIQWSAQRLLQDSEVSPSVLRNLEQSNKRLKECIQELNTRMPAEPPDASLLYWRFMRLMNEGREQDCEALFAEARQARKLAYLLTYREKSSPAIAETEHLRFALNQIKVHWRDRLLSSILLATLDTWGRPQGQELRRFLSGRLDRLESERPRFLRLKAHRDYFVTQQGPVNLAFELIEQQKNLTAAPELIGVPASFLNLTYFGSVCEAYTRALIREGDWQSRLSDILDFLHEHGQPVTTKKVLSLLILTVEKKGSEEDRDLIKKVAVDLVGDPNNDAYWHPWEGASDKEQRDLAEAQLTLNQWIIQQFIEIFFDSMDMNKDRKLFWRKYLKHIRRFKIFGQWQTQRDFKKDDRLAPYLSSRFGLLQDDVEQNALVMEVNDYYLVEFSFSNSAFYAYTKFGAEAPDISREKLSIHRLKPGGLRRTFVIRNSPTGYGYEYRPQGKLAHNGDWQQRLSAWIEEKVF